MGEISPWMRKRFFSFSHKQEREYCKKCTKLSDKIEHIYKDTKNS